jgi:hypothetical protein
MQVIMLTSTFKRMANYAPAVEAALDRCWPQHPRNYFIADCEMPQVRDHFSFVSGSWTEVLLHGLLAAQEQYPALDYVFLMLDDHCPLRPCDAVAISAYLEIARSGNLAVISFPTYEWPWDETTVTEYPDGLVRMWRRAEIDVIDGRRLAMVPRDFFRYFQVQPAFWNIEYLITACRAALASGIRDPWAFEGMRLDGTRQHYVADYNWPNVHHGFITAAKINPAAISYMSKKAAPELRRKLIREVVGVNSVAIYRLYRLCRRGANVSGRVGKALLTRLQLTVTG